MLRVWKDAIQIDELQGTQVLSLVDSLPGTSGTTYNLTPGTGSFVYQVYKFSVSLIKLTPTDYTVTNDQLILTVGLISGDLLLVIPSMRLDMLFGGSTGDNIVVENQLWIKRDTDLMYSGILVYSEDLLTTSPIITQNNVLFTAGVSSEAFAGLIAGSLVGRAACFDGQYAGMITANTATSIMLDNAVFTQVAAKTVDIITVSHLQFAPDIAGSPGVFTPVLNLPAILDDTVAVFWVRDSYTIPDTAINFPNNVIRVKSMEYTA